MVEYALRNCSGLVEVKAPFGNLIEILDLDNGLGPHMPAFHIHPGFGFGEFDQETPQIIASPQVQSLPAVISHLDINDHNMHDSQEKAPPIQLSTPWSTKGIAINKPSQWSVEHNNVANKGKSVYVKNDIYISQLRNLQRSAMSGASSSISNMGGSSQLGNLIGQTETGVLIMLE